MTWKINGVQAIPVIAPSWRNNWSRLTVFFDYPPAIRKVIDTTNAVESLNASLQKVLKPKKSFNRGFAKHHFIKPAGLPPLHAALQNLKHIFLSY